MADKGLVVSTKNVGEFALAVSDEATKRLEAGDQRFRAIAGEGAFSAFRGLDSMSQGARASFAGQFSGIGKSALLAVASKGARSPMELMQNLEKLEALGPKAKLEAIRGVLGDEGARVSLLGEQTSTAGIEAMMGALDSPSPELTQREILSGEESKRLRRRMGLSRIRARADATILPKVEGDIGAMKTLTRLNTTLETLSLNATKQNGALVKVMTGLQSSITSAVAPDGPISKAMSVIDKLGDLIDKVSRHL